MFFLVDNIINHVISLASGIGKGSIAVLPMELIFNKILLIDPFTAVCLYYPHQICQAGGDRHAKKNMHMIFPTAYCKRLCVIAGNNTR